MIIGKRCRYCGSENVVKDAYAEWNPITQEYELSSLHDDEYCRDCEESGNVIEDYKL